MTPGERALAEAARLETAAVHAQPRREYQANPVGDLAHLVDDVTGDGNVIEFPKQRSRKASRTA
jgi:hypothetical protein